MKAVPLNYPDELWFYDNDGEKICPSWAEVYYCRRYDTFLYVFANKKTGSISGIIDADELKNNFFSYDSISIDKSDTGIKARCIYIREGANEYQIAVPEKLELLNEIINGNITLDITRKNTSEIFETNINDFTAEYTNGKYITLNDFYIHESETLSYFEFLKKLNGIRFKDYLSNSEENELIDLGALIMPFPFSGIGFFRRQQDDTMYYDPIYNIFVYRSQISQYRRLDGFIKTEYRLVKVPVYTTPYRILRENNLNTELSFDETKIEKMYSYYDLRIYVDSFLREYGYRSKSEIEMIYKSICKYKNMEYKWFKERGIKVFIDEQDMSDINKL